MEHHRSSARGGQPGKWLQLGIGPTTIATATNVAVLSAQTLAAGEIPVFHYGMKTTPTGVQKHLAIKTADTNGTNCTGFARKETDGTWSFVIRHEDGAARDFDWQALRLIAY